MAIATLGNVNRNKNYGVSSNSPFVLYASPFNEARIKAAFSAVNMALVQGNVGVPQISGHPVNLVFTFNQFVTPDHPILILPKYKIQRNEAMAPTNYAAPDDILTLNRIQSVWSIYGAAVGDDEQCMQINLV